MTDSTSLVDRLAAYSNFASIPRSQLEWLAAHGEIRTFSEGAIVYPKGDSMSDLYIVLSGRMSIQLERGGAARKVKEWNAGDVTGILPYSRMVKVPGDTVADEPVETLVIPGRDLQEMIRECHEFTALCVHEMVDRARVFKSDDLQLEKILALGRISAGLAHDLNNPASAMARSAKALSAAQAEIVSASRELGAACLDPAQTAALERVRSTISAMDADGRASSPLERSDREDEIGQWLEKHGLETASAESLADSPVALTALDEIAGVLSGPSLGAALRYVAADAAARRLTSEVEMAASRIHSLVAAMKAHTRMDRAPVLEPVRFDESLQTTTTLLSAKARGKSVTVSLDIEPSLPVFEGYIVELNQVWSNLIDNAIDAAPTHGHVNVTVRSEHKSIVVSVVDDGPGVPPEIRERIFDPYFTTKPVGEGSGLGLDIAQTIVRAHGGSIELSSRPGRTEFRVRLPLAGRSR